MVRMIRRIASLVVGLVMMGAAGWLSYEELFAASYLNWRVVACIAFLFLIGGWLLWGGFLFPLPKNDAVEK